MKSDLAVVIKMQNVYPTVATMEMRDTGMCPASSLEGDTDSRNLAVPCALVLPFLSLIILPSYQFCGLLIFPIKSYA